LAPRREAEPRGAPPPSVLGHRCRRAVIVGQKLPGGAPAWRSPKEHAKVVLLVENASCGRLAACKAEIGHSRRAFLGAVVFSKSGARNGNFHGTS